MNSLLSLDSHSLFFDDAEKESFDIDSFLSPTYDMSLFIPPLDGEAVLITPFSSPHIKQNINENNSETMKNDQSIFKEDSIDQTSPKMRRSYKKSETNRSRQRKSEMNNYIKDLERRVTELVNENIQLKDSVCTLSSDKERLETEVLRMQKIMRKNMATDDMDLSQEELDNIQLLGSNHLLGVKPNCQSTATILLILLLSFSLLFHQTVTSESYDIQTSNRSLSDIPHNSPKLEKKDTKIKLTQNITKKLSIERESKLTMGTQQQQKVIKRVIKQDKNSANRSTKKRKAEQKSSSPQLPLYASTPALSLDHRSIVPEINQWRPNTTYLLCKNVSQILPPSTTTVLNNNINRHAVPVMVSLLIPPDALGTTQENTLLEVLCQVIDVSSVPLRIESV